MTPGGRAGRGRDRVEWHNRAEALETIKQRFADVERLEADDIAGAIAYIVSRPRHVAINELLVRPTEQRD